MRKLIRISRTVCNVVKNTIRLRLWRAAIRKIWSQSSKDIISEAALTFYHSNSMHLSDAMTVLGIEQQVFNWTSDAESYLSRRKYESHNIGDTTRVSQSKRQRMGGIASVEFLYSLVKTKNKKNCLECGVSMGGSSLAILRALHDNNEGVLYSNDLPYLWMDDPLQDLGVLVSGDLRDRWTLTIGDDRDNLPSILKNIGKVDMALYDSNKAYSAREEFWTRLIPFMDERCSVIYDDIVDNDHFFDLARSLSSESWKVFIIEDKGKLFGLLQKV